MKNARQKLNYKINKNRSQLSDWETDWFIQHRERLEALGAIEVLEQTIQEDPKVKYAVIISGVGTTRYRPPIKVDPFVLKLARYYFKKSRVKPLPTFEIESFFKAVEQWAQDPDYVDAIWGLIELEHTANPNPEFSAVQIARESTQMFLQAQLKMEPIQFPKGIREFLDYTYDVRCHDTSDPKEK